MYAGRQALLFALVREHLRDALELVIEAGSTATGTVKRTCVHRQRDAPPESATDLDFAPRARGTYPRLFMLTHGSDEATK